MSKNAMSERQRAYDSYEGFLRESIKTYWDTRRNQRINFLALLFASQSAWGAAWDEIRDPTLAKKVLTGAAGAAAVALILRVVLGGPVGLLLTGASIASLVALYARNNRQVVAKVSGYREIIADYRPRYDAIADEASDEETRHLMIDGLMTRFLDDLDTYEPPEEDLNSRTGDSRTGFQKHIDQKRDEE